MKILAIYPWTHISSSALMINGKLISAGPEERFNRRKWSTDFPILSAEWCLKEAGIKWKDLDVIVVPWNPSHNINSSSSRWDNNIRWRGELLSNIPTNIMKALKNKPADSMEVRFGNTKILYLNHHECHAASAFFGSGYGKSDFLTIDGHGESETCVSGYFSGKRLIKTNSIYYPHSVGLLYGTFTDFLGFKPDSDEWKTMALASYSTKKNIFDKKTDKLYKLTNKGFELDLSFFDYYQFDKKQNFFNNKFCELFGPSREKNSKINSRHHQIAGALQRAFEKIVFHLLSITKKTGCKSGNIVIAGGAAMNCVFNGILNEKGIYKNNYIPPWPDDSGVGIGATYLTNFLFKKKNNLKVPANVYLGPSFSNKKIIETIKKYNLKYYKPKNIYSDIADKIKKGNLIGWFQDRMEFSHRALGNRSIIADPRKKSFKDKVNLAIKYRENFRPFAPATLEEHAHKIFNLKKSEKVYFMEKAIKVRNSWKNKIPAVVHVDNTARVQTVSKKLNPKFYRLIQEFDKLTGVPVLLNTSFNLNGEPIVLSPSDAIRTFYTCGLDYLVLGDYVIKK